MKAVWAHKKTRCNICGKDIPVRGQRLDDTIKTKYGALVSLHYHPDCAWNRYRTWWDENPYKIPIRQPKGKIYLNKRFTPDQLEQRRRLIIRLGDLRKHYSISKPISANEQKRLARYRTRLQEYLLALIPLGGIPKRYRDLGYTEVNVYQIVNGFSQSD